MSELDTIQDEGQETAAKLKDEAGAGADDAKAQEQEIPKNFKDAVRMGIKETIDPFRAFLKAPREIIGVNIINVLEGMAYFGTLTLLVLFLTKNVGLNDVHATWIASGFTMLITISQLIFGGVSDKIGAVKSLGIALVILMICRLVIGFSEFTFGVAGNGLWSPFFFAVTIALAVGALSYGLYQPAIYSVTRKFSTEKTSAVSFAMLYAGMNLGAFIIGFLLPFIRHAAGDDLDETGNVIREGIIPGSNGYSGALIVIAGVMVIAVVAFLVMRSKSTPEPEDAGEFKKDSEKSTEELEDEEEGEEVKVRVKKEEPRKPMTFVERLKAHPFADLRFDFFIFILIPVQTLFAYQNILIPAYLERCFGEYPTISENFEIFSNFNPLIVVLGAPLIAALTARNNVYNMMIVGTTVMALPAFLLGFGVSPVLFLTYVVISSIGESIWQPRFLQHVAEIAPKDKVGAYIGIAQLPWFLTKAIVGLYVGFFMQKYIPDLATNPGATQNPGAMWFIFACIAMISPVALLLARRWMNPKKQEA